MGIKKAYDDIKSLYNNLDFHIRNERAINKLYSGPIGHNMENVLRISSECALLEMYKNVLDIIEKECPEVLEKNISNKTRKCKECNKEFTIHHPSQKFCCKKCRENYWNRKRAERYQYYLEEKFEEQAILEDLQEW